MQQVSNDHRARTLWLYLTPSPDTASLSQIETTPSYDANDQVSQPVHCVSPAATGLTTRYKHRQSSMKATAWWQCSTTTSTSTNCNGLTSRSSLSSASKHLLDRSEIINVAMRGLMESNFPVGPGIIGVAQEETGMFLVYVVSLSTHSRCCSCR